MNRYVKFTKVYTEICVLYLKKEKKKILLIGKKNLQFLEPDLTILDLRLVLFCCVTPGKLHKLSVPYFPIVTNNSVWLMEL